MGILSLESVDTPYYDKPGFNLPDAPFEANPFRNPNLLSLRLRASAGEFL